MHGRDKLRSIRAKLAVLEGKMALSIMSVLFEQEEFMLAFIILFLPIACFYYLKTAIHSYFVFSISEAKKTIEQKQKRIDEARRAQRLLRNACIVWHNPADEVLLSGSFDGWASQVSFILHHYQYNIVLIIYRGNVSIYIYIYCRERWRNQILVYFRSTSSCTQEDMRYVSSSSLLGNFQLMVRAAMALNLDFFLQMKFIVDGVWKLDPLRPIVYDNGYENNLLIVI